MFLFILFIIFGIIILIDNTIKEFREKSLYSKDNTDTKHNLLKQKIERKRFVGKQISLWKKTDLPPHKWKM